MEANQTITMKWSCKIYLIEWYVFMVNHKFVPRDQKGVKKNQNKTQWPKMKHEDNVTCQDQAC